MKDTIFSGRRHRTIIRALGTRACLMSFLALLLLISGHALARDLVQTRDSKDKVLLVDDSRVYYYTTGASYFTDALETLGLEYDIYDTYEEATTPTVGLLASYKAVIWTTGDNASPFVSETARRVEQYLDEGGAMFISSLWLAEWLSEPDSADFMHEYLHLGFEDYARPLLMEGRSGDPITSGLMLSMESPLREREYACLVRNLDNACEIILTDQAQPKPNGVAARVPSDDVSLPYRVVVTCFPYESIVGLGNEPEMRYEFLSRALAWLVDEVPPHMNWSAPADGAQVTYSNTAISLELSDVGAGVDTDSIELMVNGHRVEAECHELSDCLSVRFCPEQAFAPGSQVAIRVSCDDRYKTPNQMGAREFSFSVSPGASEDTSSPHVLDYGPLGDVTRANSSFAVFAVIADEGTGVDRGSLTMTINGASVAAITQRTDGGCVIGFQNPCAFRLGRSYDVVVTAQDLACPPNQMDPLRFSFSIPADVFPPYVARTEPQDGAILDFNEFLSTRGGSRISVWFKDFAGNVAPASLRMMINGELVSLSDRSILNGLKASYYPSANTFNHDQQVIVRVWCSDAAFPSNQMEPFSWTFTFGPDTEPPTVENTRPRDGRVKVPRNANIFILLSSDTDPSSVSHDSLTVECQPTGYMQGEFNFDPNLACIQFVPYTAFSSGATVSVTLDAALSDYAGNAMVEPFQFQFRAGTGFDFEAPSPPTNLTGRVGDREIRISWAFPSNSDVLFCRVYYDSDGCCEPYEGTDAQQGASPITVFGRSNLLLTGLDNAKTYHIAVTAMDRCAQESDYSNGEFVASPATVVDAPHLEEVIAGNESIFARWEESENLNAAGYRLYYAMVSGPPGDLAAQETRYVDAGRLTTYRLYGLVDEATYEVWVAAYDHTQVEGEASNAMLVTPSANVDWLELHLPGAAPTPRSSSALVLDPVRKLVYVLGGTCELEEDVLYALNLKTFRWEIVPTTGPFPSSGPCFAFYDETQDAVWMIASDVTVYRLDLSDHEWTAFQPTGQPPPISYGESKPTLPAAGFLDSRRNRLLLYGCFIVAENESGRLDYTRALDFYSFGLDTHEWLTLDCSGVRPTEVYMTAFAYMPSIDRGYLFGGLALEAISSKIYALDPESLSFVSLATSGTLPMQRITHAMTADEDLHRVIVFGGDAIDSSHGFLLETNQLNSYDIETSQWHSLTDVVTGIPPTPREYPALLTVPRGTIDQNTYMLTFGGYNSPNRFDDLHCLRLYDHSADITPPARVTDLTAQLSEDKAHARLSWTAPGDDGTLGRASGYDLRLSATPILTDDDFANALTVPVFYFPLFPGTTEFLLFPLPEMGKEYYFALKTFDEAANYSAVSNCASAGTSPESPLKDALLKGAIGPCLGDTYSVGSVVDKTQTLK